MSEAKVHEGVEAVSPPRSQGLRLKSVLGEISAPPRPCQPLC